MANKKPMKSKIIKSITMNEPVFGEYKKSKKYLHECETIDMFELNNLITTIPELPEFKDIIIIKEKGSEKSYDKSINLIFFDIKINAGANRTLIERYRQKGQYSQYDFELKYFIFYGKLYFYKFNNNEFSIFTAYPENKEYINIKHDRYKDVSIFKSGEKLIIGYETTNTQNGFILLIEKGFIIKIYDKDLILENTFNNSSIKCICNPKIFVFNKHMNGYTYQYYYDVDKKKIIENTHGFLEWKDDNAIEYNSSTKELIFRQFTNNYELENECVICFEKLKEKIAINPCGHSKYHKACLDNIKQCPICRRDIISIIEIF